MKIDLKKDLRELYRPGTSDFTQVHVPVMRYLAIDGRGDPSTSEEYATAVESLYTVAYATKFALKARSDVDFVVGPLEALWSSADHDAFTAGRRELWDWTLLIPLPDPVSPEDVAAGTARAAVKKPHLPVTRVRLLELEEGRSLQIMHLGPYPDEAPTLARLHDEVMPGLGVTWNGPHHEIYLSDPRRVPPEKLRTVLRQPVREVAPEA